MLVTVVATTVAPTFASTVFDEGNTITFRGHFVLGTSYKVNDIVMYNGTLYKCLIGNAIVDPNSTQFWTPYLNTNYDNSNECESAYNEGLKDGYNEGYTKNYTPVRVYSECNLKGKIIEVTLTDATDEYCIGTK